MALDFLKKLFGSEEEEQTGKPTRQPAAPEPAETGEPDIEAFVTYVVQNLVDAPEQVSIDCKRTEREIAVNISCEKSDIGKVIGKNGRTISAIRTLASGAGGRLGRKISVEVLD